MSPLGFTVDVVDRVAVLTLSRPDRLNALTFESYRALAGWFRSAPEGVRAAVLTGEGRGFCSGGDVEAIIGALMEADADGLYQFTRLTVELVREMRAWPWPIVSAVNGVAAGAGAILAMASDLRFAAPHSRVHFLFNKVGLSGADMGACFLLPRIVGLGRATELLMTGDPLSAEEGYRIGFFNRVVPAEALVAEATALAGRLAAGPGLGLRLTKEMLNRELAVSLDTALEMEAQAQTLCMLHPDFREAHVAWREGRRPAFR